MLKQLYIILLASLILGCTLETQKQADSIQANSLEEPKDTVVKEEPRRYFESNKSTLYIDGENWVTLIDLKNFMDSEWAAGLELPPQSMFLFKKRSFDNDKKFMYISVFAEVVQNTGNSADCRAVYMSNNKGLTEFGERNGHALATFERTIPFNDSIITSKHINSFAYRKGYCFDFHISLLPYEEDDLSKFYDVFDSIEFVDETPGGEAKIHRIQRIKLPK